MAAERQGTSELRAYLEYFWDMGVHDFYRNGEPVASEALAAEPSVETVAAVTQPAAILQPTQAPVSVARPRPALETASHTVRPAAPVQPPSLPPEQDIPRPISFNDLAPLPTQRIPPAARAEALNAIRNDIGDCTRCPLAYAGRRTIVFGDGDPNARLMFVGEGPGADEDAQGLPFVGKSGQLLNNMIAAMGLQRDQVYIANIVKCRPPANRAPEPAEANTCTQFLLRQMDVVQPEFIVALGATAAAYLLGVRQPLASLRGRFHPLRGAQALVTFHPAYLLRDPRQKAEAWKDLQRVMAAMKQ